jgi:hypothetical protein
MPDERADRHEIFGALAEFETPEALVAAAKEARHGGYRDLDAFTPFPVPELNHILQLRDRRVLFLGLYGGIAGFCIALAMQVYSSFDYPLNVGGRPLLAVSAFAVVAFELTVLFAALTPAIGMLALNGLPRLSHPLFESPSFHLASRDRFFLCVLASDAQFDVRTTSAFLRTLHPLNVELVRA